MRFQCIPFLLTGLCAPATSFFYLGNHGGDGRKPSSGVPKKNSNFFPSGASSSSSYKNTPTTASSMDINININSLSMTSSSESLSNESNNISAPSTAGKKSNYIYSPKRSNTNPAVQPNSVSPSWNDRSSCFGTPAAVEQSSFAAPAEPLMSSSLGEDPTTTTTTTTTTFGQQDTASAANAGSSWPSSSPDEGTVSKQVHDYLEKSLTAREKILSQQSSDHNHMLEIDAAEVMEDAAEVFENLQTNLQSSWRIFQEAKSSGYDWKIGKVMVLAGDYDIRATKAKLDAIVRSAGCAMFILSNSPSCKQAAKAMEVAGANVAYIELDDPLHAELAKKVGRASVPAIFIGGIYVGGFDEEVSEQTPGIFNLAFQGKLRPMLEKAGALRR
jgi:glutaredoxin